MTNPDPQAQRADTRTALADPDFVAAWDAINSGMSEAYLTEGQVAAVTRARKLTGTPPGGLPMPIREGA